MPVTDRLRPTYCPAWSLRCRTRSAIDEAELAHARALDRGDLRTANGLELVLTLLRSALGHVERLMPRG